MKLPLLSQKKHKKFFEELTEKDFIVEKEKSEETYKKIVKDLLISGVPSDDITENILPTIDFSKMTAEEALSQSKKLIKIHALKEGY